jgi:hypothetical protein
MAIRKELMKKIIEDFYLTPSGKIADVVSLWCPYRKTMVSIHKDRINGKDLKTIKYHMNEKV